MFEEEQLGAYPFQETETDDDDLHEGRHHEGRCMWLVRPLAFDDRLDVTCESKREVQDASKDLAQANEMMELSFTEMMGHIYDVILTSKKRLNQTWSVTISSG